MTCIEGATLFDQCDVNCPAADWRPAIVRNVWNPTHLHLVFVRASDSDREMFHYSPLDCDGWESDVDPWAMMARGYRFLHKYGNLEGPERRPAGADARGRGERGGASVTWAESNLPIQSGSSPSTGIGCAAASSIDTTPAVALAQEPVGSSLAPGRPSCCAANAAGRCGSGGSSLTTPTTEAASPSAASTVRFSGTRRLGSRQSLSARLTESLIFAGLVRGTTRMWTPPLFAAPTPASASSRLVGDGAASLAAGCSSSSVEGVCRA